MTKTLKSIFRAFRGRRERILSAQYENVGCVATAFSAPTRNGPVLSSSILHKRQLIIFLFMAQSPCYFLTQIGPSVSFDSIQFPFTSTIENDKIPVIYNSFRFFAYSYWWPLTTRKTRWAASAPDIRTLMNQRNRASIQ
jgi:hypothetical protein